LGSSFCYFFRSTNIEHTNTPGSAGSKWKPSKYFGYQHSKNDSTINATCDCPATEGQTSETLTFAQTTHNISDRSQSCDCLETTTISLETLQAQLQVIDKCECTELTDQSDQELVKYKNGICRPDAKYNCSCSGPNRFTVPQSPTVDKYSDPTGSNKFDEETDNDNNYQNSTSEHHVCSCPMQEKWTHEQLALIRETNKFSGGSTDCICVSSSEFSLALHKKLQSLTTTRKNTFVNTVP
jgi:hypothetical protein